MERTDCRWRLICIFIWSLVYIGGSKTVCDGDEVRGSQPSVVPSLEAQECGSNSELIGTTTNRAKVLNNSQESRRIGIASALKRVQELKRVEFFDLFRPGKDPVLIENEVGKKILRLVSKSPSALTTADDDGILRHPPLPIYRIRFGFRKDYMTLSLHFGGTAWIFDDVGSEHQYLDISSVLDEINDLLQSSKLKIELGSGESSTDWSSIEVDVLSAGENSNEWQAVDKGIAKKIRERILECPVLDTFSGKSRPKYDKSKRLFALRFRYGEDHAVYVDVLKNFIWIYDDVAAQKRAAKDLNRLLSKLVRSGEE